MRLNPRVQENRARNATATLGRAGGVIDRDLWPLVVWAVLYQRAADDDISLHDVEMQAFARSQGFEPRASSSDGCWTLSQRGALGCSIDGGGAVRGVSPRVHPDAEDIVSAINRLSPRDRGTILRFARTGEPPAWIHPSSQRLKPLPATAAGSGRGNRFRVASEWRDMPLRSRVARARIAAGLPILDRHGRSLLEREEKGFSFRIGADGRRQVLAKWTPLVLTPSDAFMAATNGVYSEWHAAMARLLGVMGSVALRNHSVSGFDAPAAPWTTE